MVLKSEIIQLTPAKAEELLNNRLPNRKISQATVEMLASDMKNGRWRDNGIPITCNEEGKLGDGMHRCAAVVLSGCTIPFVIHYVDNNSMSGFDFNRTRSTKDELVIEGNDNTAFRHHGIIGGITLSIMLSESKTGSKKRRVSKFEQIEVMNKHKETIEFAHSLMPTTIAKISKAGVFAAIFAAYENGYDKDKLSRFVNVLKTGFIESQSERSIVRLRDYLMRNESPSTSAARDICYTVMNVLWNYDKGHELTKIYVSKDAKYPIIS